MEFTALELFLGGGFLSTVTAIVTHCVTDHKYVTRHEFEEFRNDMKERDAKLEEKFTILFKMSSDDFLMGWSQQKIAAVTILHPHQFLTIYPPTSTILPQFSWLYDRHTKLLTTFSIHFLTNDLHNLFDSTPAQWHIRINTHCHFMDQPSPEH